MIANIGSIAGVGLRDRQIRDRWLTDGTHQRFGVLANAWKETVRDAMADIAAHREAATAAARRAISARTADPAERKRLYTLLKRDQWPCDPYLRRLMRRRRRRGRNRTHDQIVGAQRFCARAGQRRLHLTSLSRLRFPRETEWDRLDCTWCRVVWAADHAAAINILRRHGDPDITTFTPHHTVRRILQDRADRHRTRLPVQDSNRAHTGGGERTIHPLLSNEQ